MAGRKTKGKNVALRLKQSEKYQGEDWWDWAVWLEGPAKELAEVKAVEYTLHSTFADPVRTITTRRNGFKLSTAGWGVFPIYVRVMKKNGKVIRLRHQLQLHYPGGAPVTV